MAGNVSTIAPSIQSLAAFAEGDASTVKSLHAQLVHLTEQLEAQRFAALALITETITANCAANPIELPALRLAVIELCERLLVAAESTQPFDFSSLSATVQDLLFPAEPSDQPPTSASQAVSSAVAQPMSKHGSGPANPCAPEAEDRTRPATDVMCHCSDIVLLKEFFSEAIEHMETAEQLVLKLESARTDPTLIDELFRVVHSLKGASGVCELDVLCGVAHRAESILVHVRDKNRALNDSTFGTILLAVDYMSRQLKQLRASFQAQQPLKYQAPSESLRSCLVQVDQRGDCDAASLAAAQADLSPNLSTEDQSWSDVFQGSQESIRVDAYRLEQLIDLIGELVITEGAVQSELSESSKLSAAATSARLRKVVREVQQLSLTLKMVPIGSLLQKFNRLVRDLSERLGKPARLMIRGGDTEIDKHLLECIADPLVHIIRNSLDHGIESSIQERIKRGKPEVATIEIQAEHRAGSIDITISDDGQGLNRDRILARGIERGLVAPDAKLSVAEIENLIFAPGFSTAANVTEVSGRGVGMDVVRTNVQVMHGDVQVSSSSGYGTQIRLVLPLTLSIIDGTVVRVGSKSFVVPTLSVVEQFQLTQSTIRPTSQGDIIDFRNRYIALRRLGDVLIAEHRPHHDRSQVCLVIEACGQRQALVVDEVLSQQPVVIKPLGSILDKFDFYSGGALLPSGEVALVLDLNAVCRQQSSVHEWLSAAESWI